MGHVTPSKIYEEDETTLGSREFLENIQHGTEEKQKTEEVKLIETNVK